MLGGIGLIPLMTGMFACRREPEKFGTGHVEGIVESGSANNSALAGAWIPGAGVRHPVRLDHRNRNTAFDIGVGVCSSPAWPPSCSKPTASR